jgi:hypothetical protein
MIKEQDSFTLCAVDKLQKDLTHKILHLPTTFSSPS